MENSETTLRSLAESRGFHVGAAVAYGPLQNEVQYRATLAREFNMLTAENAMKFQLVHPDRDRYTFDQADAIVAFARAHALQVRGHTLVWHNQLSDWVKEGHFSGNELKAILREHIQTEVDHFRGQLAVWDVVNEAISDDGGLRDTLWLRGLGPEYLDLAFHWAHEADPAARLFYNDYNAEGLNPKSDAIYALVKGLKERGVPIHGVGLQAHLRSQQAPGWREVAANMERLTALGLEVQVTELDVQIQALDAPMEERLARQAEVYADLLRVCLSTSNCTALVLWGFTDRHTWIPGFTRHPDWPLIFDADYQPKPAYHALREVLAQ